MERYNDEYLVLNEQISSYRKQMTQISVISVGDFKSNTKIISHL